MHYIGDSGLNIRRDPFIEEDFENNEKEFLSGSNKIFKEAILQNSVGYKTDCANKDEEIKEIFKNKVKQLDQSDRNKLLKAMNELKRCKNINTIDGVRYTIHANMVINNLLENKTECKNKSGFFQDICDLVRRLGNELCGRVSSKEIIDEFVKLGEKPPVILSINTNEKIDGKSVIVDYKLVKETLEGFEDKLNKIVYSRPLTDDEKNDFMRDMKCLHDYLLKSRDKIHDRETQRLFGDLLHIYLRISTSITDPGVTSADVQGVVCDECNIDGKVSVENFNNAIKHLMTKLELFNNGVNNEHYSISDKEDVKSVPDKEDVKSYDCEKRKAEYLKHAQQQKQYLKKAEAKCDRLNRLYEDIISKHSNLMNSARTSNNFISVRHECDDLIVVINKYKAVNNTLEDNKEIDYLISNITYLSSNLSVCKNYNFDRFELYFITSLNKIKKSRDIQNKAVREKMSEIKEFEASIKHLTLEKFLEIFHLLGSVKGLSTDIGTIFGGGGLPALRTEKVEQEKRKVASLKQKKAVQPKGKVEKEEFINVDGVNDSSAEAIKSAEAINLNDGQSSEGENGSTNKGDIKERLEEIEQSKLEKTKKPDLEKK